MKSRKDSQTVTSEGRRLDRFIDGVIVRPAVTHEDERGEITEIYNPAWGITDMPLVYVYQALLRPGKVKGWVYHEKQDDRMMVSAGFLKLVLYDMRKDSPTHGMLNEITMTERNRKLVVIPHHVVHAVQNIGTCDAVFINMPTRPYQHADPDKFRIDMDSGQIPYTFDPRPGW